jgi:fatty-acid peroxygenase
MLQIPRDNSPDGTLAFLREGYPFISRRCERHGSDLFRTRLLLQDTICMRGEAAARLFYDVDLFTREDAAPIRLRNTLFGRGAVQGLDGEAHRRRKQMFMSLMSPERIAQLARLSEEGWQAAVEDWQRRDALTLLSEVQVLLCRAVCRWAGVPLPESQLQRRTQEMARMIDSSGAVGPRHIKGKWARKSVEAWLQGVIEEVRAGRLQPPPETALHVIAWHREDGELLPARTAAVELVNVLRPTVAIARFIAFAALALHEHPQEREALRRDPTYLEPFVQEVRRVYGFFPVVAARMRRDFDWRGYHFPQGTRVLLDLWGTNRDPRSWQAPQTFRPARFRDWDGSAFNFIPQGGGEHHRNHRCPGEWITIALMKVAVNFLVNVIDYRVPEQDLSVDLARIPAQPSSGFVIEEVKRRAPTAVRRQI